MKLWLLKKTTEGEAVSPEYDTVEGFVIVANDPYEARKMGAAEADGEGADFWMNTDYSIIMMLSSFLAPDIPEGIVLRAFRGA